MAKKAKPKRKTDVEATEKAAKSVDVMKYEARRLQHLKMRLKEIEAGKEVPPNMFIQVGVTMLDKIPITATDAVGFIKAEIEQVKRNVAVSRKRLEKAGLLK